MWQQQTKQLTLIVHMVILTSINLWKEQLVLLNMLLSTTWSNNDEWRTNLSRYATCSRSSYSSSSSSSRVCWRRSCRVITWLWRFAFVCSHSWQNYQRRQYTCETETKLWTSTTHHSLTHSFTDTTNTTKTFTRVINSSTITGPN